MASTRTAGCIKSLGQFIATGNQPPFDIRNFSMKGNFSVFYGTIYFELENLALFNNAAYSVGQQRLDTADQIDDEVDHLILKAKATTVGEDEDEFIQRMISRRQTAAYDQRDITLSTMRYADEHTIIACWAFAEKYINRTINELNTALFGAAQREFRWSGMKTALLGYGIDLTTFRSYADANECRVVNNTIKHSGLVSPELAQTQAFAGKEGQALESYSLSTQRYYFGVYDFIGELFEQASAQLPMPVGLAP